MWKLIKDRLPGVLNSFETRLFVVVWLVYAVHVVPGGGVNPNRYFDLTHSLINQRSVKIDAYHENTIDKAFKDGHYYALGLPGPSIAGMPAYVLFKGVYRLVPARLLRPLASVQSFKQGQDRGFYQQDTTAFFLSTIWITWFSLALISALAAVALLRVFLGLGVARADALIGTFAYAFGTPVFFYSTTYFSAGFAASLVILSIYFLMKVGKSDRPLVLFFLLGLTAGSAVLMEYQSLFLAGGVAIYVLLKWKLRASWSFVLGAAVPCALLLAYNTVAFGGPFHSSYEFVVGPNAQFHQVGALGFTLPRPERLFGLTFSTHRGLFFYAPVLLLSVVGFVSGLRRRTHQAFGMVLLAVLVTVAVWLLVASFAAWDGSSAFGPRLLVCTVPLMAIGVALSLARVPRMISIPLVVLSIVINWLGAQYGFAENIWQPWERLWTSGFTLPALSALISHSRTENALSLFVTNWMWLIALAYAVFLVACFLLLFGSSLRQRRTMFAHGRVATDGV